MIERFKKGAQCVPFLFLCLLAGGCATYHDITREANNAFQRGDYKQAAEIYHKGAEVENRNRLLYLLDEGMSLHCARDYEASNRALLEADALMDKLDYTSVSTETAALVTTDRIRAYAGVDYEYTLVSVFLAINFLMLDDLDNARVEARRISQKLERIAHESGEDYKENLFGRYLRALVHEAMGEHNDAYVEYKIIHENEGEAIPYLTRDLYRLAEMMGFDEEAATWRNRVTDPENAKFQKDWGRVVLFYECGRAPKKVNMDAILTVPVFQAQPYYFHQARLELAGEGAEDTHMLHNIEQVAKQHLEERVGRHLAKAAIQIAAKEAAAESIERLVEKESKSSEMGDLAGFFSRVLFYSHQSADLRSWLTLPANLQLAHMDVPAGTYDARIVFQKSSDMASHFVYPLGRISVAPGRIVFLHARTTQ